MTSTPEVIDLHAVPHPTPTVRRAGFPLDHPYLEQCWTPIIGPSSVLLLRRCAWLWREGEPAHVTLAELASQLGLGKGTGRSSPVWHTLERVDRFRFASFVAPGEMHVFTEVPPVPARQLERLPRWCRNQHEHLLTQHIESLSRAVPTIGDQPSASVRMAERLDRLAMSKPTTARSISR